MDTGKDNSSVSKSDLVDSVLLNQLLGFDEYVSCRNELHEALRMYFWNISNVKMKQSNTFGSGVGFFNTKFDITKDLREDICPCVTVSVGEENELGPNICNGDNSIVLLNGISSPLLRRCREQSKKIMELLIKCSNLKMRLVESRGEK